MAFSIALLQPFLGYVDLGMWQEANDELEDLPNEYKTRPEVLSARLELLMAMHRWEDGVILASSLCKLWPDHNEFYLRAAFCLHELKQTAEAKTFLLNGPAKLQEDAVYFYNLACYEAQLGDVEEAKRYLSVCFGKDKKLRADALEDPDLEAVWTTVANLPATVASKTVP